MYIASYTSKGHHIYGDYCIQTEDDGSVVSSVDEPLLDLREDPDGYNHYTYIIGENGTGKSSFIRNLICHEIKVAGGGAWIPLAEGGADYIPYTPKNITDNETHFNQIIHICNKPFLRNREIKDFYHEYVTMQDDALYVLLSFLKKKSANKRDLGKQIGRPMAKWRLDILLLPSRMYNYEGGTMSHQVQNSARIEYLFRLLNAPVDQMNDTSSELYNYYSQIQQSPHFPLSEITCWQDFRQRVMASYLYRPFMKCVMDMKIGLSQPQYDGKQFQSWLTVSDCMNKLNENDVLLLPLYADLQLISINMYCDGVLVDSMSSGEQMMIQLFSYLSTIVSNKLHNALVVIDEPETSLHPLWQKQYPSLLREIVEKVYGLRNSHIVVTTHSPFIVMDASRPENGMTVLRFEKENNMFGSKKLENVALFNIEHLILEEFNVTYRSDKELKNLMKALQKNDQKDPIKVTMDTDDLKQRIESLYREVLA